MFRKLNFSVSEGIASIVLNNPKNYNAIDVEMIGELLQALDTCENDNDIKVVVLSGEGKVFSAGGDIGTMYKGLKSNNLDLSEAVENVANVSIQIKKLSKPVIASLKGAVAGASFNIALACDFRVAADDTNFIQAFVNIGLIPDAGGIYLLTRAIGVSKATELVMTGKPLDANTAFNLGLVYKVVDLESLEDATRKLATRLANGPSLAYAGMKDLIFESEYKELKSFVAREVQHQIKCLGTEDFKEGIFAFVEKRAPNYKGK